MKFSESWLREWVNPALSTEQLVAQLTMAGLEVDGTESVAGFFTGVLVGEILSVEPHPNAEKLQVCQVQGDAAAAVTVVCGAPNARPGIKVPFATIGAVLPGDFKIKKAKLRGVESFGMLCGADELAAGEGTGGLWELPSDAPVGEDLRTYMGLDDTIIEVDLTPNRADCLSIRGLAREVAALNQLVAQTPPVPNITLSVEQGMPLYLDAGTACSRYAGRVIQGVDPTRPSPIWLVEKLRRSGIRSIDPIVDVTNFVLLELGQPMHAFDLNLVQGGIRVRLAEDAESITLLDGQTLELQNDTLVIADDSGAIALAGIMGGASTAVNKQTRNIFLESAYFAPAAMAGRARRYGLHTDSSHRFERGVDPQLQVAAVERATELLLAIAGGQAGPLVEQALPMESPCRITLSKSRLVTCLGTDAPLPDAVPMLTALGLTLIEENTDDWMFEIPSYRFDLRADVDLIEEVARVYGYDSLPKKSPQFSVDLPAQSEQTLSVVTLKRHLASKGFQEAITYSFIEPSWHQLFFPEEPALALLNPISSDLAWMRTSLIPGLVHTLRHNLNRQQSRVRLFESGLRFKTPDGTVATLEQTPMLAALVFGAVTEPHWSGDTQNADFFDLKGDLESLLALTLAGNEYSFHASNEYSYLHPGQTAELRLRDRVVGVLGALHPKITRELGVNKPVVVFECELAALKGARSPHFVALSRYPSVARDLAVLVARDLPVAQLERVVRVAAGEVLKSFKLFDLYCGEGIDPESKSLAFSLTFQDPSRTLTDEDINASMSAVVAQLEQQCNASLR